MIDCDRINILSSPLLHIRQSGDYFRNNDNLPVGREELHWHCDCDSSLAVICQVGIEILIILSNIINQKSTGFVNQLYINIV